MKRVLVRLSETIASSAVDDDRKGSTCRNCPSITPPSTKTLLSVLPETCPRSVEIYPVSKSSPKNNPAQSSANYKSLLLHIHLDSAISRVEFHSQFSWQRDNFTPFHICIPILFEIGRVYTLSMDPAAYKSMTGLMNKMPPQKPIPGESPEQDHDSDASKRPDTNWTVDSADISRGNLTMHTSPEDPRMSVGWKAAVERKAPGYTAIPWMTSSWQQPLMLDNWGEHQEKDSEA